MYEVQRRAKVRQYRLRRAILQCRKEESTQSDEARAVCLARGRGGRAARRHMYISK